MSAARSLSKLLDANYALKKLTYWLLGTPLFTRIPLYKYCYLRHARKKISILRVKPSTIQIENTNLCNMSCVFCPHETMKRPAGVMADALFERIINQCRQHNIEEIILTGFGEPLMDKNFAGRVRLAKQSGIKTVSAVTNGVLLTPALSEQIIDSGLDMLSLSLDAASNRTYDRIHRVNSDAGPKRDYYREVEDNIRALADLRKKKGARNPVVQVRLRDFELNKHDIPLFFKTYRGLVDQVTVYLNIFNWPGSAIQNTVPAPALRFPCVNLWTGLYITYGGAVLACCQDYEARNVLGNIGKDDILSIWNGDKLARMRQRHLSEDFISTPICRDCVVNTHFVSPWWL